MLNRKVIIIHSLVGLIKKSLYKMSQYFPKLDRTFGGNISVNVDLSNYEKKSHLMHTTGVDTSKLAAKSDLSILKAEIDKKRCRQIKNCSVPLFRVIVICIFPAFSRIRT